MKCPISYRRPRSQLGLVILLLFITMIPLSGCSGTPSSKRETVKQVKVAELEQVEPIELYVSAAMSLKDALQKPTKSFEAKENARIIYNFASSGDLQVQIERGAPADVFISAGEKQMDALEHKKLIDVDSRINMLSNRLVIIVPGTSALRIEKIEDIANARGIKRIAVGNPDMMPAGKYAKEALESAYVWSAIQPKIIPAKDVRQILNYVETGNVDTGLLYLSDAKTAKNAIVALIIPESYHSKIMYPAAVLSTAEQPEIARRFIKYLKGKESANIFKEYGFKPLQSDW